MTGPRYQRPKSIQTPDPSGEAVLYEPVRPLPAPAQGPEPEPAPERVLDTVAARPLPPPPAPLPEPGPGATDPFTLLGDDGTT